MDLDSDNGQLSDFSDDVIEQLIVKEASELDHYTVDDAINKIGIGLFQLNIFLFSGLTWGAHAQIILQIAVLGPSWQCEFQLTNAQLATITTMIPLGNILGSIPIGLLCDKYGRKKVVNIANLFVLYFSLMSVFVPKYFWVLVLRLIVGIFVIASNQSTTYCLEFMPVRFRAPSVISLNLFFSLGTGILILLSYAIIPTLGWRYLVLVSSLSCTIIPIYYWFVPTSPRFLVKNGKYEEARKVLELGARMNRSSLPKGQLVHDREQTDSQEDIHRELKKQSDKRGILEIFNRKYAFTTLCVALIWFTSGFLYYGVILISSDILTFDHHCTTIVNDSIIASPAEVFKHCHPISSSGYLEIFITSMAEVPGILITVLVVDIIGRKLTMALELLLSGIMFFLLFLCTPHAFIVKTVLLFTIRASITGVFNVGFLYTGEVYPTHVRASVLAFLSTFARLATVLTSYTAQVLFRADFRVAIILFGSLGVITGVISLLLPYETKGKKIE